MFMSHHGFLSHIPKLSHMPWVAPGAPGHQTGCQPCACPSRELQRKSPRAGPQLPAAAAGLTILCAGQQRHVHPCLCPQHLPHPDGTGCDLIVGGTKRLPGSKCTSPGCAGCQLSSAWRRHDSGQPANSSETAGAAETWQVRSISHFSLLSWSSDTAKKSKDAQKL